jgi:hypothetical protein
MRKIDNVALSVALTLSLGYIGLAACSAYQDDRGKGDAPVNQLDDTEVTVYPNGDGFPNIAIVCTDSGNGIYTTTREVPPVVVTDDPECKL